MGKTARLVLKLVAAGLAFCSSFTLANIMCCLSGLLLGPVGGVASALGSALYDLTNPAYAAECWITFITKGIMGMVAGFAMKDRATPKYGRCTLCFVWNQFLRSISSRAYGS